MSATEIHHHTLDARRRPAPEKELVPRFLVVAMIALMGLSLSLVAYARLTGAPMSGALIEAPVAAERTIRMVGTREGSVTVLGEDGVQLAHSSDDMKGFIGVVWRVLARHRYVQGVPDTAPVTLIRRDNGNIAIHDTVTDWSIELIGYGADNVAAFAGLVD
ncbi:photosynthetic complex assembly protein PuhC [Roseovarius nanhaiticus]|uniref:photosynthetic complex assembly protein PuhC n=1 Tax=Roseovarius nanhaiticus TaxID=573024 RepID=UPI002490EDAC|nr:photosynthetic complex assembly protein PuhC [Roseovarius nanhaiticus]